MEKAMVPHSSTFAWRVPWLEEPGGLQSMGSLESDTTERLHFHFPPSCIGEGNGNPLQCSCLENPRDRGAWWAAVYGVAQSWTRLKRLSSSSSSSSSRLVNWPNCNFVVSQWIWGPKEKGRDSKCPDFGAVRTHTTFINQVHYLILVGFLVLQLQQ